ncbi:hypothetical protein FSP39_001253 [Pinctada imbricata]|uniref:Uncharacterized protein n=1 Tax=Pinctada imbricata TaxID=66713 RepID=A0AA88YAM7_PINIB|nr:hypothetical protein FSP39_001253 [Pinctada imbricata]
MGDRTYDFLYKIVLVGNLGVGKTSIARRFAEGKFSEEHKSTIGVDFTVQTVQIEDKIVKLQIWDTSGQERFRSITQGYYRNAHGAILVYDITNRESFQDVERWLNDVQQYSGYSTINLLIGNKSDLHESSQVSLSEAESFAGSKGMLAAIETSAKSDLNVDQTFYCISKELLRWNGASSYMDSLRQDSIALHSIPQGDNSWYSCCSYS